MLLRQFQQQRTRGSTGGAATGSQKAEGRHRLESIAPSAFSMETCLSKIGLCCKEGCYYGKERKVTCQFVTECLWSHGWASKRASRLPRSCAMSKCLTPSVLSFKFAKYVMITFALLFCTNIFSRKYKHGALYIIT